MKLWILFMTLIAGVLLALAVVWESPTVPEATSRPATADEPRICAVARYEDPAETHSRRFCILESDIRRIRDIWNEVDP